MKVELDADEIDAIISWAKVRDVEWSLKETDREEGGEEMTRNECDSCKDRLYEWADIEKGDMPNHPSVEGRYIFFSCISDANEDTDVIESYILNMNCNQYKEDKK